MKLCMLNRGIPETIGNGPLPTSQLTIESHVYDYAICMFGSATLFVTFVIENGSLRSILEKLDFTELLQNHD